MIIAVVASTAGFSQTKDVVDIAIGSADHTTLVAAVKAADLVTTLKSKGPFTVFAPTNAGFDKLPAGTVATLLKPENKAKLAKILTYHVVSGNLDAAAVMAAIKAGKDIAAIAKERNLSTSTIDGHLAYFVGTGEIDINNLVSKEKQKLIK